MLFFYSRVTPLGGTATNVPKNVLLCTAVYNEQDRRRASDDERARKQYIPMVVYHTYIQRRAERSTATWQGTVLIEPRRAAVYNRV